MIAGTVWRALLVSAMQINRVRPSAIDASRQSQTSMGVETGIVDVVRMYRDCRADQEWMSSISFRGKRASIRARLPKQRVIWIGSKAYLFERVVLDDEVEADALAVSLELLLLSPFAAALLLADAVEAVGISSACCPSVAVGTVGCCCRCLDERRGIYGAAMCWREISQLSQEES